MHGKGLRRAADAAPPVTVPPGGRAARSRYFSRIAGAGQLPGRFGCGRAVGEGPPSPGGAVRDRDRSRDRSPLQPRTPLTTSTRPVSAASRRGPDRPEPAPRSAGQQLNTALPATYIDIYIYFFCKKIAGRGQEQPVNIAPERPPRAAAEIAAVPVSAPSSAPVKFLLEKCFTKLSRFSPRGFVWKRRGC